MEQRRFIKLQLDNSYTSEQAVTSLIDDILETSASNFSIKKINHQAPKLLTDEVMYKEINSLGQAYIARPYYSPIVEDVNENLDLIQCRRPLSAKIERQKINNKVPNDSSKKKISYRSGGNSTPRSSGKYSLMSNGRQKEKKCSNYYQTNYDKFYPLASADQNKDEFQESFINSLRQKKILEQVYQKSKEQFLKTSAQQKQKYPRINKKFIQIMGNKTYYYNKNGQAVEVNQVPVKTVKRVSALNTNRTGFKASETSKRVKEESKTQTMVEYSREKDSGIKKMRETFEIETKQNLLFYKSENCKYQILC